MRIRIYLKFIRMILFIEIAINAKLTCLTPPVLL